MERVAWKARGEVAEEGTKIPPVRLQGGSLNPGSGRGSVVKTTRRWGGRLPQTQQKAVHTLPRRDTHRDRDRIPETTKDTTSLKPSRRFLLTKERPPSSQSHDRYSWHRQPNSPFQTTPLQGAMFVRGGRPAPQGQGRHVCEGRGALPQGTGLAARAAMIKKGTAGLVAAGAAART